MYSKLYVWLPFSFRASPRTIVLKFLSTLSLSFPSATPDSPSIWFDGTSSTFDSLLSLISALSSS